MPTPETANRAIVFFVNSAGRVSLSRKTRHPLFDCDAFKKWTGIRPSAYVARIHRDHAAPAD